MDGLDVRILRTMGFRPYERTARDPEVLNPGHIARIVGVTPETVKARIARMEESGVITGYRLLPNLAHLGLSAEAYYFHFEDDDDKDGRLADMASMGGLLEIHDFLGRGLCVDFAYRNEAALQEKLAQLARQSGVSRSLKFYVREMPPVTRELTNLDWRILGALTTNAKRSLYDVALELGVSGKTVKRHYDRMAQEGSFFSVPRLDPSRAEGLFLFELLFFLEPGGERRAVNEIRKTYNGSHVYSYVPSSLQLGNFDMLLFAQSTGQVEQMRREGAGIPGVTRCEAWFFRGFHDHSGWIDQAIGERIAAALP